MRPGALGEGPAAAAVPARSPYRRLVPGVIQSVEPVRRRRRDL